MSRCNQPFVGHWNIVLCNSAVQSVLSFAINNWHFVYETEYTITAHVNDINEKIKLAISLKVNTVII